MDNILIYAILGGSIGILIYIALCEMQKTYAHGTANNLQSRYAEALDENEKDDDSNPGAVIQNLNMKNALCSDSLDILNDAITKLRKEHKQKKDLLKQKLETCNASFNRKLNFSKKFRDDKENNEAFLAKLNINRKLFKD